MGSTELNNYEIQILSILNSIPLQEISIDKFVDFQLIESTLFLTSNWTWVPALKVAEILWILSLQKCLRDAKTVMNIVNKMMKHSAMIQG